MRMYQMYVCDKCGFESREQPEVELCEAKHMGLSTLEEKHQWDALNSFAGYCTARLSTTNNEALRDAEEKAYQELFAFEKKHNMTTT